MLLSTFLLKFGNYENKIIDLDILQGGPYKELFWLHLYIMEKKKIGVFLVKRSAL